MLEAVYENRQKKDPLPWWKGSDDSISLVQLSASNRLLTMLPRWEDGSGFSSAREFLNLPRQAFEVQRTVFLVSWDTDLQAYLARFRALKEDYIRKLRDQKD